MPWPEAGLPLQKELELASEPLQSEIKLDEEKLRDHLNWYPLRGTWSLILQDLAKKAERLRSGD
jgi:hypothetical protein